MTDRAHIEQTLRALYAARSAGDVDETLKNFAERGVFKMHARGIPVEGAGDAIVGKAAVRTAVEALIKDWRFDDWKVRTLLVDGNKAALHWQADVTNASTRKRALMHGIDLVTFENGMITNYRQAADTALMMRLAG